MEQVIKKFLQKIKLTDIEKLWLNELYEFYKKDEYIRPLNLKRKLWSKIDINFKPQHIDNRLVKYGYELTPLGILFVDQKSNILNKIDTVFNSLKNHIQKNFKEDRFIIRDILKESNISIKEFLRILHLIKLTDPHSFQYTYEDVHSSNSTKKEQVLRFQSDDAIEEILTYENIEKYIDEKILQPKKLNKKDNSSNIQEKLMPKSSSQTHSIFRSKIEKKNSKRCFVLMPFSTDWSKNIYESIRINLEKLGIQCLRADNDYGSIIIEDIWIQINASAILIADVTGRNPNVMYELGIAHAIDVPTILITQEIDSRPFDTSHLRHYVYKNDIAGSEFFEKELPIIVKEYYKKYYDIDLSVC